MHPLITNRKSVFPQFFTDRAVSRTVLEELLEAANMAPSHRKTEPWRFRVYRGDGKQALKAEMMEVYGADRPDAETTAKKFGQKIDQSAAVLLIFMHRDPKESVPEWEEIAAVGAAVENLWLSLHDHGLGGYWSSPGFVCGDYGAWPGAAGNERCLGFFYLGYPDAPNLPRPRGDWREKVRWVEG
ncbi:nitroreductase [Neolewinella xylanilytica]|uniref:Nitroreductase n=1 Tax=Neolewinella xylanilytica TaxID=1514080 RepID=A0A2S6I014_9BACT|nr:nitroreductase [Neolewinella xylanilytica]PPK84106.1 nitroreductase [Neolewinella xylanilytica]